MSQVRRIFVEKKAGYDVEAQSLYGEWKELLGISQLENVRVINRYDIEGVQEAAYQEAKGIIFSEPPVDILYEEKLPLGDNEWAFAVEYLPGQYDQRADSAAQCLQMLTHQERPMVRTGKVIVLKGNLTQEQKNKVKAYTINPVEAREAAMDKPQGLQMQVQPPQPVADVKGFIHMDEKQLEGLMKDLGLAMSFADLLFCQQYFRDTEKRNPSVTEIRVIDTYWSDHCRHTTFLTEITHVDIEKGRFNRPAAEAYSRYLKAREQVYGEKEKPVCLMDIAVMGMKELKKQGKLNDLDESEEINACSIVVPVEVDGKTQEWLVMFKNETHNHPTEIEPFGGAATCLGGAIRDPLSGRAYVYQAMRVTGSGDPRTPIEQTLPGKLPQRKITTGAAAGYSSYGNQIGLATGQVAEVYDEGFVAKRMEIGAVIAAAPKENVIRKRPEAGDVIILVGGRTGRDGCGGATGSSKEHTEESLTACGAEVQKGNPPTERKLQRLFRKPEVSRKIKRCNDFGAGGVSVAIGELAEGLTVDLNAVPKKYEGLDGTELAISESQERMAVVVAPEDVDAFIALAEEENVEATRVAVVTADRRLKMQWQDSLIVDISRDFLDTNGAKQTTQVHVLTPQEDNSYFTLPVSAKADLTEQWQEMLADLNVCSQKGLVERFDSSIGAGTVLMPFGGASQMTPAEGMAAKIPLLEGDTDTATLMTYGYNPQIAKWSPFHGAVYAVVEAVAKVVAMGGDYQSIRLTLQEYFERLGQAPEKWGKPFSALLGALFAQEELGIAAIGGKDSMSGTFMDLHVPPTLVAFAVNVSKVQHVLSPEFKQAGSAVVLVPLKRDEAEMPDFAGMKKNYSEITRLIREGAVLSAQTVRTGGIAAAVSKMTFGNRLGMVFLGDRNSRQLFSPEYGSIILEVKADCQLDDRLAEIDYELLGYTQQEPSISVNGRAMSVDTLQKVWEAPLEPIFPTRTAVCQEAFPATSFNGPNKKRPSVSVAKPKVLIPVFPGTNCEYDTAKAFAGAGAKTDILVIRNQTASQVEESINELAARIQDSQMIMLPGGFSAGDEPDGSGKFIATMFRNPQVKEAVRELLHCRDGLMMGICNGFQALIKLGLVPYGDIVDLTEECPTLTYNRIGRHISTMVRTKITSNLSPWLANVQLGDIHTIAVSHGEGRFAASREMLEQLRKNGQIATQYVDSQGQPSYDICCNPNCSVEAIEGITSPDGRVFGKMGHSERIGKGLYQNIPGEKDQQLFAAGVAYFK